MKSRQNLVRGMALTFVLLASLSFPPFSTHAVQNTNSSATTTQSESNMQDDIYRQTVQCQKDARSAYRRCLKRGRGRARCRRQLNQGLSACSG